MADYTATGLITSVQKKGMIPSAQITLTTTDFLRFMDEEMRLTIVPFINSVRENYFVSYFDQSIVGNQNNYSMPPRAIGMKLKNVYYVDLQSFSYELPRIDIDDIPSFQSPIMNVQGIPRSFYIMDNTIFLVPVPPSSTGTLRQYYYVRRNTLVDTSAVGKITALNTTTGVLTLNNVPSTFLDTVTYDLVKGTPGFQTLATDLTPTTHDASSVTFSAASLPAGLAIGDYVCLSLESPVPQIPYDLFPLLVQRTLASILRANNDLAGSSKAEKEADRLQESSALLIGDRVDESAKKIVSANNIGNYVFGSYSRW